MKSKVTQRFLTLGLMLMTMAVFLLPLNGYAEHYEINWYDILGETLIWDLSGSYSDEFLGCELTYELSQNAKGKITGSKHVVCSGYLEGHSVDMEFDLDLKGKIKQKNGVATVKISMKIKGIADVPDMAIYGAKISGKQKITAAIDPVSRTLIGTVQEKVSIKGLPSIKETDDFSIALPSGMDGTWSLAIDVNDDGKKMVGGSQLWLSNGRILPFFAKGKYKAKTNETKFTLKGTDNASGCKLSPVINEGTRRNVTSIKGKVLGQKISGGGGGSDSNGSASEDANQESLVLADDISFVGHDVISETKTRTVTDYSSYTQECTYTYDSLGRPTPHCNTTYDTRTEIYTVDTDIYKYTIDTIKADNPPLLYKWYVSGDASIKEGDETGEVSLAYDENDEFYLSVAVSDSNGNSACRTYNSSSDITSSECNDTSAPSVPADFMATKIGYDQIDLSWSASTDDNGIIGYRVYRDGTLLSFSPTTSYSDTGLNDETEYCYTVSALDVAGNESTTSSQKCISPGEDKDGDGYNENQGDCDDSDATIYPGAPEICGDSIDNNCNDQVDEGCPMSGDRFTDMGDGTVRDNDTGLIWLKDANSFEEMDWAEAMDAAANLNSGEHSLSDGSSNGDWRLPTKDELQGIGTDPQSTWSSEYPSVTWTKPGVPFTSVQTFVIYWSSTGNDSSDAWCVDMYDGYLYSHNKSSNAYTWLVRSNKGGESHDIRIHGTITNINTLLGYAGEDSYLQLVYLPPDGSVNFTTDGQGRFAYTSDLPSIDIPESGSFAFTVDNLFSGDYFIAPQLLESYDYLSKGGPIFLKSPTQLYIFEIPEGYTPPLDIAAGNIMMP
jgi:hypothetical protein